MNQPVTNIPQCVEVQHVPTGAVGTVITGGFRPRVRWTGGRISRIDSTELRLTGYGQCLWLPRMGEVSASR